jgi:putative transcriptional regulator
VSVLGNRLKLYRMRSRLTQRQLAEMLGIATSTYNMIENGKRGVSLQRAKKLEEILGAKIDELFSDRKNERLICEETTGKFG